jgi:hypothetical protein
LKTRINSKGDKKSSKPAAADPKDVKIDAIGGEPNPNADDGWLETQIHLDAMIAL